MKIWIETEFNYGKGTSFPTQDYRRNFFIDPKAVQLYLSYDKDKKLRHRQLLIWISDGSEDAEFTFDFDKISGLLIDVKDKEDFMEMRLKNAIITVWERNNGST